MLIYKIIESIVKIEGGDSGNFAIRKIRRLPPQLREISIPSCRGNFYKPDWDVRGSQSKFVLTVTAGVGNV
jgi:hypothetical protein